MSSSQNTSSNFSRKPRISVRQVWRRTNPPPQSPPQSQNASPPQSPRVANSLPSPPQSQNLLRDQMVNEINELHHLSHLIETNLQNATNAFTQTLPSPPSPPSPMILPATLDQVNFHSRFCHCCMYNRNQFQSLRNDLNWIEFLLTRPPIRVHVQQNNAPPTSPPSPPQN
ncbi:hypothetical protein Tco_0999805 [Tanacetum coccineum]